MRRLRIVLHVRRAEAHACSCVRPSISAPLIAQTRRSPRPSRKSSVPSLGARRSLSPASPTLECMSRSRPRPRRSRILFVSSSALRASFAHSGDAQSSLGPLALSRDGLLSRPARVHAPALSLVLLRALDLGLSSPRVSRAGPCVSLTQQAPRVSRYAAWRFTDLACISGSRFLCARQSTLPALRLAYLDLDLCFVRSAHARQRGMNDDGTALGGHSRTPSSSAAELAAEAAEEGVSVRSTV